MDDNLRKLAEDNEDKKEEKETQSQVLIRLATGFEVFHTKEKETYATFKVRDHYETWPLKGSGFKLWLTKKYFEEYGKAAGGQGMTDALNVLNAKALFEGKEYSVFTRIAEKDNVIYIDLCNENWEVVKVDENGWEVISNPPCKFVRSNLVKELPRPVRGGSLGELKQFINFQYEDDWKLIVAWILAALRPGIPYPLLNIQGEQGSAKSTTTKVIRAIVDPSQMPLRNLPKEERDLSIAAKNTWVLAFDNLSGLSNMMSDALCKLSTGGGLATRKLYSDDEEAVFNIIRPVILNGIDDIAKRQDLLDRAIVISLPSIKEEKRTDEKTFWENFEKSHARILGALLNVLSEAIKELPSTKLKDKPRMADFAQWVTAAEKGLEWEAGEFLTIYTQNRNEAIDQGLDSDPVAVAVQVFMQTRISWEGTAAETVAELGRYIDERTKYSKAWPSDRKLKERLRRIAPGLRTKGIEFFDIGRTQKGATLRLEKTGGVSSLSTPNTSISNQVVDSVKRNGNKSVSSHDTRNQVDVNVDNEYKIPPLSNYEKSELI
ncbi:hypothetical protein SAMN05444673_0439 [Bacillus sp. OV166]|uniref:hypothetical protein n=1 Tax=Bacillus sp. OV166 TaxID=1882763 RepID=UPI000A2AEE67|nr:hypothetical protein [Bacillus sp. OV166]SMQ60914.1 hypothetical protein SAMN05444673_0439 [Bacillus sp. OV166]